ncbi:hypothetical protein QO003_002165 [Arthrobacter silviterrae]|uniref:DUF2127 domain-containing protein n=1 Tax=Arthrobacter silviterrae TaxID=2026658 RepID=A0ABX0DLH8_9MICC|nr:hypothetical protein [Arthrobacter silviterrae]MDQ0277862.1 hypothetical protein [Arthrobacter silviterrae]NGN85082.1 hypothetical protein [Arthrobacter silviterrae]
MTTPDEQPQERPTPGPGHYGEIAPGVPRYGQYAPAGWQPPQPTDPATPPHDAGTASALPPASAYPGYQGSPQGPGYQNTNFTHRGSGPLPTGSHYAPPRRVVLASRLIMAAGALQALALVLWLVAMGMPSGQDMIRSVVEQSLASNPQAAAGIPAQTLINVVAAMLAVFQAVAVGFYFWMAWAVRKGRRWARTLSLVLAVVSIVMVPEGVAYSYYSIARILLGIVAVVILLRPPARDYFAKGPQRGSGA